MTLVYEFPVSPNMKTFFFMMILCQLRKSDVVIDSGIFEVFACKLEITWE